MKTIALAVIATLISIPGFTQTQATKIVLTKDQPLKFTSTVVGNISQNMMGQSIDFNLDITSNKNILTKDITPENYTLDVTTTRMKMNMTVMGQEKSFDSDKQEDMNGDMKGAGKEVNVVKQFSLDTKGKCKAIDQEKKEEDTDPMGQMMQQLFGTGNDDAAVENCFMLIPADKKLGDTWTDSAVSKTTKTIWNYSWDSTQANIATVRVTGKVKGSSKLDAEGMEMNIELNTDIAETRKIDIATGIIKNKVSVSTINSSAQIMGQSIPIEGTVTTTGTIE